MKHMYLCHWRPDILAALQRDDSLQISACEAIVNANDMTCSLPEVTCSACRDTYIEALPTGTQKRTSFVEPIVENLAKAVPSTSEGWSSATEPAPDPWKTK